MSYNHPYRPAGFGSMPVVTKNIIFINVLMYAATWIARSRGIDLVKYFGLHYHLASDFKPHQFITYIFMHADISHIFFNMLGVFMFGQLLEQVWGPRRFLIFYLLTGLGAALAHYIVMHFRIQGVLEQVNQALAMPGMSIADRSELIEGKYYFLNAPRNIIIGASGSLYGLMGAFAMLFPNTTMYFNFLVPVKAKWLVLGYALVEYFSAWMNNPNDRVAHFAHLGGLFVGIIIVLIWRRDRQNFY